MRINRVWVLAVCTVIRYRYLVRAEHEGLINTKKYRRSEELTTSTGCHRLRSF